MRFASDIATGIACMSGALAVLAYLRRRAPLFDDARRAAWFAIAGLSAFGLSRFLDAFMVYAPDARLVEGLEIVSVTVALILSLACWGVIPGLIALPSAGDLMVENARLEAAVAERTRALDEANQRFVHALKTTHVSMAQQDLELRYQWVHNLPGPLNAKPIIGRLPAEVFPAEAAAALREAGLRALEQKNLVQNELTVQFDGVARYFDQSIEPLWRDGEIVGLLTTAIDATEHRRRQEELTLLLSEVTHRTKNLLAVIQGMARQSSRSATDVQNFVQKFNGRIRALAATHELLVETKWRGVELRRLLNAVWQAAWPAGGHAIVMRGPPCALGPECAQNVAVAVHEMAANAVSHLDGARAPDIVISWAPVAAENFAGLELVWREKAPARPAPESDFGSTLVEDLLPRATEGPSRIAYDESGLLWTLRIDGRQLRRPD